MKHTLYITPILHYEQDGQGYHTYEALYALNEKLLEDYDTSGTELLTSVPAGGRDCHAVVGYHGETIGAVEGRYGKTVADYKGVYIAFSRRKRVSKKR